MRILPSDPSTAQMTVWVPLISALLGAIIGSVSAYLGNLLLETRKRKYETYTKLNGKKRILGQIYFSLITERVICLRIEVFKEKCGKASDPTVSYELKRHAELADKFQFELNECYSDILELLSSIELVFKRSDQLYQKINTIIKLNEAVNDDQEKMMNFFREDFSKTISAIRPRIDIIPMQGDITTITTYNTKELVSTMNPVFQRSKKYVGDYINTHIQWPFDDLLIDLKNEIQGKDNEALQAWRVQISP